MKYLLLALLLAGCLGNNDCDRKDGKLYGQWCSDILPKYELEGYEENCYDLLYDCNHNTKIGSGENEVIIGQCTSEWEYVSYCDE